MMPRADGKAGKGLWHVGILCEIETFRIVTSFQLPKPSFIIPCTGIISKMDGDTAVWEPPAKRRRLSVQEPERIPDPVPEGENDVAKETRSGITAFVSPNLPGFSGVLKQRLVLKVLMRLVPAEPA